MKELNVIELNDNIIELMGLNTKGFLDIKLFENTLKEYNYNNAKITATDSKKIMSLYEIPNKYRESLLSSLNYTAIKTKFYSKYDEFQTHKAKVVNGRLFKLFDILIIIYKYLNNDCFRNELKPEKKKVKKIENQKELRIEDKIHLTSLYNSFIDSTYGNVDPFDIAMGLVTIPTFEEWKSNIYNK